MLQFPEALMMVLGAGVGIRKPRFHQQERREVGLPFV